MSLQQSSISLSREGRVGREEVKKRSRVAEGRRLGVPNSA